MSAPPRLNEAPLSPLARALASRLGALYPDSDPWVLLSAALLVEALARGDSCLLLANRATTRIWPDQPWKLPRLDDWLSRLRHSPLVGEPGTFRPLILVGERLYLARYQAYEQRLAEQLMARAKAQPQVDEAKLTQSLARLFPQLPAQLPDWQKVAAAQAVRQRLLVISGGPGTGKTTTVIRLLAALLEQPGATGLRIALAAPTGKAANRMSESLAQARNGLPVSQTIKERLPSQAQTLHSLLGLREDQPQPRHHRGNPLPVDVLVVDEASMVDLALMAKLVDAIPPQARLVLLGDKDQLSAVEAGAVFAELCAEPGLGQEQAQRLGQLCQQPVPARVTGSAVGESVILLSHSYRFAAGGGIGQLAAAILAADPERAKALLGGEHPDLIWQAHPQTTDLLDHLYERYQAYLTAARARVETDADVAAIWQAFNDFRALAALREGPWGVNTLNQALEARIRRNLKVPADQPWYPGRAVLIGHNNYQLKLFNGDIGLCLNGPKGLQVYFPDQDGWRVLAPGRLPGHDSAFVMTVHKSQGSEFGQVLLALPDQSSPILSRALLYTGITRAQQQVEIWAQPECLEKAINNQQQRASGLAEQLRLQQH